MEPLCEGSETKSSAFGEKSPLNDVHSFPNFVVGHRDARDEVDNFSCMLLEVRCHSTSVGMRPTDRASSYFLVLKPWEALTLTGAYHALHQPLAGDDRNFVCPGGAYTIWDSWQCRRAAVVVRARNDDERQVAMHTNVQA